ncbi:MAG: hypothetical protein RLZZ399_1928 [Verrucomicrobiota bacterium]|jgi:hypothetical protein
MAQREYDIVIRADGSVKLEIQGHPGKSCLNVAKLFEEIVGQQVAQELTREYYEPDEEVHTHLEQGH